GGGGGAGWGGERRRGCLRRGAVRGAIFRDADTEEAEAGGPAGAPAAAEAPRPPLAIEHRAARVDLDGRRDEGEQGRGDREPDRRAHDIDGPLGESHLPIHGGAWQSSPLRTILSNNRPW